MRFLRKLLFYLCLTFNCVAGFTGTFAVYVRLGELSGRGFFSGVMFLALMIPVINFPLVYFAPKICASAFRDISARARRKGYLLVLLCFYLWAMQAAFIWVFLKWIVSSEHFFQAAAWTFSLLIASNMLAFWLGDKDALVIPPSNRPEKACEEAS